MSASTHCLATAPRRSVWRRLAVTLALATCAVPTTGAFAVPVADPIQLGAAGLAALDRGAYQEAVGLFTRILAARHLKADDRELAYLKRGEAKIALGMPAAGEADLRAALKIHPEDAEAQRFLEIAESARPSPTSDPSSGRAAASRSQRLRAAWGAMAQLPGRTWLEIDGKPLIYFQYEWERPFEILTVTGMDRSGKLFAGRYQLDEATSQISAIESYKGQVTAAQIQATADGFTEDAQTPSPQSRATFQVSGPGAFQVTRATFRGGKWSEGKPIQLMEVNQALVASLGWSQAAPTPSVWSGLMTSLKEGALAGFRDGVHDGVHDATQCRIAGKRSQAPGCTTAQ